MPSYKVPGVYFDESLNQAATVNGDNLSMAAFMAANHRGPTTPTLVTSWAQYLSLFGGFIAGSGFWLPYAVYQYFSNGGRAAYICRVAGSGAAAATITLNDRAGSPLPTLQIDALSPGVWAGGSGAVAGIDTLYVDITDSGTDRFNLILRLGGTTDPYIVERWSDLSMNDNDARYAPNIVNSQVAGSNYIKVTKLLTDTTPAPTNRPAVQAGTALTSGSDGGSVSVSGALTQFDVVDAPLNLNLPGNATDVGAAITYAAGRGDMFVVADLASGLSASTAVTAATALSASTYCGVYWPWVFIADPAGGTGATRLVPPGGAVLGQYAATDISRGVFKTPAGLSTRINGAIATEVKLTTTDLGNLNAANVNAIRQIPGNGVVIMGGRTLKPNGSDKYVSVRRSLIYIRSSLLSSTRFAVFEPNDSILWSTLQSVINAFLLSFWQQGGLRGASPQEAFYVKCDSDNNTSQTIAAGEVHVEIGVALQYPAEFIAIKLVQREVGAAVTVAA